MNPQPIHIIALDVPFPPNYGGVIDIYFRAKALKNLGFHVILHCFEYGRGTNHDFHEIADEIHYYKRKKSLWTNFKKEPFIVATRKSTALTKRLLEDNYPILMEGLHTTGILTDEQFKNRIKWVRIHNIEWRYYDALAHATHSPLKKTFFKKESKKLKKYEPILKNADQLFCLNQHDLEYYSMIHPATHYWAAGCDFKTRQTTKTEDFILFHGNLSVSENERALQWILTHWDSNRIQLPLYVAGKNPRKSLQSELKKHPFVTLKMNPTLDEMDALIQRAAINLLITFQSTGIKLKLINALIQGNRCVVNPLMIEGTELAPFCEVIDDPEGMIQALSNENHLSEALKTERNAYMQMNFDPLIQAQKIIEKLGDKN